MRNKKEDLHQEDLLGSSRGFFIVSEMPFMEFFTYEAGSIGGEYDEKVRGRLF